jgi:hypothetical protein
MERNVEFLQNILAVSFLLKSQIKKEGHVLSLSGFQFKMHYKILNKLRKAGALSKKNAVTIKEANLDYQEQLWLNYFAGAFLGKIKKTDDRKYYVKR